MAESFFPAEEFAARRSDLSRRIGTECCALLQGAGPLPGFEVPRQNNEFYYLTGIEEPQAYLLVNGETRSSAIYLPHSGSNAHAAGEGGSLGAEDSDAIQRISGVEAVFPLEALTEHLAAARQIYTPHRPAESKYASQDTLRLASRLAATDPWDTTLPSREDRLIHLLRERVPGAAVRDLSPLLEEMRLVKSPREVEVMRRAGALCARAVVEAIRATRPGVFEYQLGAVADYVYRVNGVRYEGYRAIIGGGENIWHAHYYRNERALRDGDLVLMDYAPDVSNYTSDIGRMWPVNGTYGDVQRELYGFIVTYHKTLLKFIRPGVTPEQVLLEAANVMRDVVDSTHFSQQAYEQAARRTLDFKGHLSHPVGMAVHDTGTYFGRPMEPGLVFALDPQMWIPEERLYIRVEDTVAVTSDGVEVLTTGCPLDLKAMEALMSEPGLLQNAPMILETGQESGEENSDSPPVKSAGT